MISTSVFLRSAALALALASSTLRAQDTSLHDWLVDGESWKVVADGYGFTDGLCCDAQGNLYFTDVKQGKGIYQIKAAGGAAELLVDDLPGISGLQIGPDGRFYACQNKLSRVIAITRAGQVEVLAEGVKCNDLVVSRKGHVYFTETPTASIHWIAPGAKDRVADKGHVNKPNGITLSADEQTLVVSDHGGLNVWTWSIGEDGALSAAEPFMTMAAMLDKETQPSIREVWTPTAANFFSRVGGGYLDDLWRDLLDLAPEHPTATTFAKMKKGEKAERLEALFRGDGDLRSALAVTEEQAAKIAAWLPEGMK